MEVAKGGLRVEQLVREQEQQAAGFAAAGSIASMLETWQNGC
jgi:acyl-coenzyme A thioesterase PaaI-like protein